jgi:hypothetical protein
MSIVVQRRQGGTDGSTEYFQWWVRGQLWMETSDGGSGGVCYTFGGGQRGTDRTVQDWTSGTVKRWTETRQ